MTIALYQIKVNDGPVTIGQLADVPDEIVIGELVIPREVLGSFIDPIGYHGHQKISFLEPIDAGADEDPPGPSFE
jgi:hypothetical protein